VLLLRSPLSAPVQPSPLTLGGSTDPLSDSLVSRAFSQQTRIRFLRVGPFPEDIQRTLAEILSVLEQEIPQITPGRPRGLSSPTPFSPSAAIISNPNLDRRGSEATFHQLQGLSNAGKHVAPVNPETLFQRIRPFQLVPHTREDQGGSSPPQSPKTLKPARFLGSTGSQEYLSRANFTVPLGTKFMDPPSPAGTPPSISRRHSRLLDSESDIASSDVAGGAEELMDPWPGEDNEDFQRALESLNLSDGNGQTWEELIDRLLSPTIPSDGNPYIYAPIDCR